MTPEERTAKWRKEHPEEWEKLRGPEKIRKGMTESEKKELMIIARKKFRLQRKYDMLNRYRNGATMRDLAKHFKLTQQTVSLLIKKLPEYGEVREFVKKMRREKVYRNNRKPVIMVEKTCKRDGCDNTFMVSKTSKTQMKKMYCSRKCAGTSAITFIWDGEGARSYKNPAYRNARMKHYYHTVLKLQPGYPALCKERMQRYALKKRLQKKAG